MKVKCSAANQINKGRDRERKLFVKTVTSVTKSGACIKQHAVGRTHRVQTRASWQVMARPLSLNARMVARAPDSWSKRTCLLATMEYVSALGLQPSRFMAAV